MAYLPDVCFHDAQYESVSNKGAIKYAAVFLYGYYCRRRNKDTGLCTAHLDTTAADTGMPYTNVSQNRAFLVDIGWIHVYKNGTIRPLKGFYTDEQIFYFRLRKLIRRPFFVQIIRILFLQNRKGILNIRNLFKGILNQHIEPTLLTSEGARPAKRRRAPRTSPDKIFKNKSAGKPALRSSANQPTTAAPAGKPTDERRFHPAIAMVKEITKRFPKKEEWDRIIREIGDKKKIGGKPNTEFFRESFEIWVGFGGSVTNLDQWLFLPNKTGKPPQRFERNGNGNGSGKPPDVPKKPEKDRLMPLIPLDERVLAGHLEDFQSANYSATELSELEKHFEPAAWAWLMENLKK